MPVRLLLSLTGVINITGIVYHFIEKYEGRLITTWPVITEASYMLDFNSQVRLDFLSWVYDGGIELHNTEQWELARIHALMKKI